MTQLRETPVTAEAMVRSRAWREGYESFRLGETPRFVGRGDKTLAYEYGRLTAAYLRGQGVFLVRLPVARPLGDLHVPRLAAALMACVGDGGLPAHRGGASHAVIATARPR